MKYKNLKFILVTTVLLLGCSKFMIKIAYTWADTYIYNKVNKYFDVTSAQKQFINNSLEKHFYWHRKYVLKDYIKIIKNYQQRLKNKTVSKSYARKLVKQITLEIKRVSKKISSSSIDFLLMLKPYQLEYYEKKVKRDIIHLKSELKKPIQARKNKIFLKMLKKLNKIFGSFNAMQIAIIKNEFMKVPDSLQEKINNTQVRLHKFTSFMKTKPNKASIKRIVLPMINNLENTLIPSFRKKIVATNKVHENMFIKVNQIINHHQRNIAIKNLEDYMDILQDLRY